MPEEMGQDEERVFAGLVVVDGDGLSVEVASEGIAHVTDHDLHRVTSLDVLLDRVEDFLEARFGCVDHVADGTRAQQRTTSPLREVAVRDIVIAEVRR